MPKASHVICVVRLRETLYQSANGKPRFSTLVLVGTLIGDPVANVL